MSIVPQTDPGIRCQLCLVDLCLKLDSKATKIKKDDTSKTEILTNVFPEKLGKEKISLTQAVMNEGSVRRLKCLA